MQRLRRKLHKASSATVQWKCVQLLGKEKSCLFAKQENSATIYQWLFLRNHEAL